MSKVNEILENLCSVEGVKGAFLVDSDGSLLNSSQQENFDTGELTRLIASSIDSGGNIAQVLKDTPLKQCIIEYSDLNLTLDVLKNGSTLALLASSGANLGRIRLEIRKTKKEIEKIVA